MITILYDNIENVNINLGGTYMKKRLRWSQYIGFITIGLVSSIIGPMLSAIKLEINLSYSQAGLILSGQFLGMLLTVLIGGRLADKYGKKPFLLGGGAFLSIGLFGSMFSHSYITLLAWTVISGIGFGTYEVGINALCSDSNDSNKGTAMNFLHFFYGLGAISGPVLVTLCINLIKSWRLVYGISAFFPIIVTIMLWPLVINKNVATTNVKHSLPYKNKFIWISGIFCFLYVGIEVSTSGWLPTYWHFISPNSLIPASLTATIFWSTLTIGRLFSGKIADKVGFGKFLIFASLGIIILSLSWAIIPFKLGILFVILLLGLALAGIFPTMMASVTSQYPHISGEISAFISIFSSLGGSLIPSAIGGSVDFIGIAKIPLLICGLSVLLFISANLMKRFDNNKMV